MTSENLLAWLQTQPDSLFRFRHGIEKEGLRTDPEGRISPTSHPEPLGSALTHPSITTDYSEALLEFITPVVDSPEDSLNCLQRLHQFTYEVNPDELVWPASMPAVLDGEYSVRIAEYGDSHIGKLKHAYRHGLWHRYGRIMQTIAGVHFNYSLPDPFWPAFKAFKNDDRADADFRSDTYFGLIRHFRRHSWLLLYLFGASPAADRSFLREGSARLQPAGEQTLLMPTATTLRMSDIGYTNAAQQSLKVCFNSLPTYVNTLRQALHTPYPPYQSIGLKDGDQYQQLSDSVLQIENEYYSDIRPKRTTRSGEKPLAALDRDGVEYVEIRCLDLNPYLPLGIDADQIRFLNWFLFWCLTAEAPPVSDLECERVGFNQRLTVLYGRDPDLKLVTDARVRTLSDWGHEIMDEITTLVEAVNPADKAQVLAALARYRQQLDAPETTPSGRLSADLNGSASDFRTQALTLATRHRDAMMSVRLDPETRQALARDAQESWAEQRALEAASEGSFDDFVANFLRD